MKNKTTLVVTSIAPPNEVLRSLSEGAAKHHVDFILIGDVSSPADFKLEGCQYYDIKSQKSLDLNIVKYLPERHYGRKNIGYLLAIRQGAEIIIETDDDNFPLAGFWDEKQLEHEGILIEEADWVNVYNYYTDQFIWPRGFPMEYLKETSPELGKFKSKKIKCLVQQGLANENPDVDAVYRLTYPLPVNFKEGLYVALGKGSWCPFNSQNTTWFKEVFMLLYLPSYCSFRMTDIWRSFVALRILHENDYPLLFTSPTVWQDRNVHNLLRDFEQEIPGYLNNDRIIKTLQDLNLNKGNGHFADNLLKCYKSLINLKLIGHEELHILDAWINDIISE
jgi:hypothetical protein